jgi:SET domain-containing protein
MSKLHLFFKVKFWQHQDMQETNKQTNNLNTSQRKIQVKKSGVHGKGVFAARNIAKGETLIEYVGEIISAQEAEDRHPHDPTDPNHTFYFQVEEDKVIDALHGGNSARWINHCCSPNCKPEVIEGRVFIKAKKDIPAGTELNYDYGLIIDEPITKKLKAQYPCWCGSAKCRGTLLAVQKNSNKQARKLAIKALEEKLKKIKTKISSLKKQK